MGRKNLNEWVRGEIAKWTTEGLISGSQAEVLTSRYPVTGTGLPWGTIIFSSLGAVIVGLGAILLLAYNWDEIPKTGKLTIILAAVAGVHAVGLKLFLGDGRYRALGEGISLLGSMLFGAGIFLVAQIYHIDEHFPNAFLIWGVGGLVLGAVLPSIPQSILAVVLLTVWGGMERIEFDSPMWLAPLLMVLVLAPQAYLRKSRVLAAVVIPGFLLCYAFAVPRECHSSWLVFSSLLGFASLLVAKSFLVRRYGAFPEVAPVLSFYGWSAFCIMLYLMSFPGLADDLFDWRHGTWTWRHQVYWIVPLVACLAGWVLLARAEVTGVLKREADDPGPELYLVPFTVILGLCDVFYLRHFGGWVVALPFNLVFVGLAVSLMTQGCRDGRLKATVIGSVLLVAVVVARYFDLFDSLLIRGLVFVVLGGVLLAEGVMYARMKRRMAEGGAR
jgi:uncharacterized membrane protein